MPSTEQPASQTMGRFRALRMFIISLKGQSWQNVR